VSIAGHDRRLLRVAEKGWARDNSMGRMVFALQREKDRKRRAAVALVKFAQELVGVPLSITPPVQMSSAVEPRAAPFREGPTSAIPGSPNDPNSSAHMRPWVREVDYVPNLADAPDLPTGPWAHWGVERPPSYAREAEDDVGDGSRAGES
jgi:hypothetical protein